MERGESRRSLAEAPGVEPGAFDVGAQVDRQRRVSRAADSMLPDIFSNDLHMRGLQHPCCLGATWVPTAPRAPASLHMVYHGAAMESEPVEYSSERMLASPRYLMRAPAAGAAALPARAKGGDAFQSIAPITHMGTFSLM